MSDTIVPDTEHRGLIERLPQRPRDYAQLARFDRPIGWWLLFWPCVFGVWLAGAGPQFWLLGCLLVGAIAMRGAGCVYNDIVDADLDKKVARTALRPVASGRVSKREAWGWLIALCLVGLAVLLQLRLEAQLVALASLALVAAYPFMKRITWWPQAWLGMVFTWGLLVGWTQLRFDNWEALAAIYAGCICWVIGFDTIYALQDREDDAMLGVKSTARLFGDKVLTGVFVFHMLATTLIFLGAYFAGAGRVGALLALGFFAHGVWQVSTLSNEREARALDVFKSNIYAGMIVLAGLCLAAFL